MQAHTTKIPGCVELLLPTSRDRRGAFVKVFQASVFEQLGLHLEVREVFVSRSRRGVLRGLHFQLPPWEHAKLVVCLDGCVLDAVVDLRVGSPTFRRSITSELSSDRNNAIFVPEGCAHGFMTTSTEAVVAYATSSEHHPEHDSGIRWNSAGVPWPATAPIVSDRDAGLVELAQFDSPFRYSEETSQ